MFFRSFAGHAPKVQKPKYKSGGQHSPNSRLVQAIEPSVKAPLNLSECLCENGILLIPISTKSTQWSL